VASTHSDIFKGQMDRDLFDWPNHSQENSAVQIIIIIRRRRINEDRITCLKPV
jgi:hypothetical protein